MSELVVPVVVRAEGGDDDGDRVGVMVPTMPDVVAQAMFYVAMEATQNATKHAGAQDVTVVVGSVGPGWSVAVTDRGRGFDPDAASGGTGLLGMRARLAAVGGRLDVTSVPGAGTRVAASVPWPEPLSATWTDRR